MVSLEGKKFWILGLLPMKRDRLLWGKFLFAAIGAICVSEFLVVASDVLLAVRWEVLLLHVITVFVLSAGLAGLSVGLGAWIPNFRETDPSKIAVGFGGTLNLIAGLLFLLLTIGLMALPYHAFLALRGEEDPGRRIVYIVLAFLAGAGLGIAAVVVPLRVGIRTLRQMEF
jgi:ABC-2 type transport system permease protein